MTCESRATSEIAIFLSSVYLDKPMSLQPGKALIEKIRYHKIPRIDDGPYGAIDFCVDVDVDADVDTDVDADVDADVNVGADVNVDDETC